MEESPKRWEKTLFVCVNEKPEGECCGSRGLELLQELREHAPEGVKVFKAKCLGHCSEGPTVACYPEGRIFTHVGKEDAEKLLK